MAVMTVFYIWAAMQGFFLGLNILQFRSNKANWFLIAFLLLTSVNILFQYILIYTDFKYYYPEYVFVSDALGLLYGPVLYLYCRQLIYNRFQLFSLLHFLPATLYISYFLIFEMYLKYPFEFYDYIGKPAHIISLVSILVSSLCYFMLCWTVVKRVRKGSQVVEFKFIFWLKALLVVICLKTLFNVLSFSLHMFIHSDTAALLATAKNMVFIASNSIVLIGLQFMINKHPYVINKDFDVDEDDTKEESQVYPMLADSSSQAKTSENKANDKKEGYCISEQDAQRYLPKLTELMLTEKPYLDAGLTEKDVAKYLDIQPYILSKLLNQHMGTRFNDYINQQRVENAKKLLATAHEKNHTMFVISIDSGFRSESAFYNNFKKFTGNTPKAYQQKYFLNESG